MKKNMGSTDKIIRILFALVVAVLFYTKTVEGTLALVLGILATVMVATSFISFALCICLLDFRPEKKRIND